jgi:hypothetical protein
MYPEEYKSAYMFKTILFKWPKYWISSGAHQDWVDKENVVYMYSGVLFSHKEK